MFKEEVVEKLNYAYMNQKEIHVTGINSYGEEFSTQNTVLGSVGYFEKGCINLINAKGNKNYATTFETKFKPDNALIIFEISIDGEVVFTNPNKEKILKKAKKHNEEFDCDLKENNKDFVADCEVVRALKQMVGKFVTLDNDFGVVVSVKGCDYYNNPIVYLRRRDYFFECVVDGESKVYTYDNENNLIEVAENDSYQFWVNTKFDDSKSNKL